MVRQARRDEEAALRAASIQSSPHPNRFIPIESQPNGISMSGLSHAQAMPSSFQFNDLSFGLPGRHPNERLQEGQPRSYQANGLDATNPVFIGDHAPAASGVSHNSTALPILPPDWNRPLPQFFPPSQYGFPQALENNFVADHARPVPQLPHRGHRGHSRRRTHKALPQVAQQALPQVSQQALPQISQQALSQVSQQTLPQVSQQALPQVSQQDLPQVSQKASPQVSQKSCSSESQIKPSFDEPSPLAADVPILSSPTTEVSSTGSLDQSLEPNANEVSNKGKDPEGSRAEYNSMVNMAPQTTVYSIPYTYATAENPMTVEQHAQLQQGAYLNAQTVPQYASYGIAGAAAPSAEHFVANDFLHLCDCGPNCQCEMCAVHPYNPTAQSHMEEIANFMASDIGNSGVHSQPQSLYGEAFPGTTYSSGADAGLLGNLGGMAEGAEFGQLMMNGYQANGNSASKPDGRLSTAEEATQLAQSDDYFTVQYSFPESNINICSNIDGTCRCGENCACMGCRTHAGHES
ncbi:MAG: hypothetical protein LQ343_004020 [Gyalolechia ehrenbergii]|nr:MAG: hypothetical protein LQ343_004020 [Gyalolechia ehrenbergii]